MQKLDVTDQPLQILRPELVSGTRGTDSSNNHRLASHSQSLGHLRLGEGNCADARAIPVSGGRYYLMDSRCCPGSKRPDAQELTVFRVLWLRSHKQWQDLAI